MHVGCDIQYKTGVDGGSILGQPIFLECMGVCILSLVHEYEMKGSLVYLLIVKFLLILLKFSHSVLNWTASLWIIFGIRFFFVF